MEGNQKVKDFNFYKNEANALLKETVTKFENREIARLIFTERMKKVISLYDMAPVQAA